jgi:glycosyltransferase involved in cell wall biosynthesis
MGLPRISIVTVCYNMENYIEKTILSVLSQNYANLEYIIVDGGSTDNTLTIINKYRNQISKIICEEDESMYEALIKGFNSSTGDILAWLNADDSYFPWTFDTVSKIFIDNEKTNWIGGIPAFLDEDRNLTNIYTHAGAKPSYFIVNGWFREDLFGFLQQEGMFWRRELYFGSGGLDINYKYAGDFELWTRFAAKSELVTVAIPLGAFMKRSTGISINSRNEYLKEVKKACKNKRKYPYYYWKFIKSLKMKQLFRLLTYRKSGLCYYAQGSKRFVVKSVFRPIGSNSLNELRYETIFRGH